MKSVVDIIRENRWETEKFLKGCENEKFTFVTFDGSKWTKNGEEVYPEDYAPYVTCADDYGLLSEYVITDIYLKEENGENNICIDMVSVSDGITTSTHVEWLKMLDEQNIYEMMVKLDIA